MAISQETNDFSAKIKAGLSLDENKKPTVSSDWFMGNLPEGVEKEQAEKTLQAIPGAIASSLKALGEFVHENFPKQEGQVEAFFPIHGKTGIQHVIYPKTIEKDGEADKTAYGKTSTRVHVEGESARGGDHLAVRRELASLFEKSFSEL